MTRTGRPILCLVSQRDGTRQPLELCVERAVAAGVDWIQVRERELDGAALLDHVLALQEAARRGARTRGGPLRVSVNRRVDVALAAGADGVHLGFDAVEPGAARTLLGNGALVGISTHSVEEARRTAADPAVSYVQLAPIADPLSKRPERAALGFEALRDASHGGLPVLAQGGIDPENAGAAIRAGAAGVAVTGAILLAEDPGAAAAALRAALDAAAERLGLTPVRERTETALGGGT